MTFKILYRVLLKVLLNKHFAAWFSIKNSPRVNLDSEMSFVCQDSTSFEHSKAGVFILSSNMNAFAASLSFTYFIL